MNTLSCFGHGVKRIFWETDNLRPILFDFQVRITGIFQSAET